MIGLDLLTLALLVGAYVPALRAMSGVWSSVEYFSHGYFVLPVALALALTKRDVLRALPPRRDARGAAFLAIALLLYFFGLLTGQVALQGVSFVLAVASVALLLKGPGWLRVLGFPVFYLIFMVPVPQEWITPAISQLRLFVSQYAIAVLHALRLPVAQDGNVILVPDGSLFVAEACSGITSMVTLVPVAVLLGYFTQTSLAPRLVLVAAVVPISMLGNLLRVLFTVGAALQMGVENATSGFLHEAAGSLIYVFGCLALRAVDQLLRRIGAKVAVPAPSTS